MDSIRPIDPRDRNPEQFLRVERLREERDPPERRERRKPDEEHDADKPAAPPAAHEPAAPEAKPGDQGDDPGEGSLIDVRV
ncbi:MAG: hypothetical protein QOE08_2515 [Thermoleophilaceae bacterium]|nr:hypothetical protein [Thermoleophilaceae bacterium]